MLTAALALLLLAPASRCVEVAALSDLHGRVGDLPRVAGHLAVLRQRGPTLVLDAGDSLQGTIEASLSKGAAVVAGYAALGVDAAALGNHEFDYGPEVLRARVAEAPYPFLAANVRVKATGRRLAWKNLAPRRLFRLPGGPAVGVFGLSGEDTPYVTMPQNVAALRFTSAAREAERQAAALRKEGAELVVALVHIGGHCRDLADPNDLSSCDMASDLFRLVRRLPPGTVDAVLAGHTHALVNHRVSGVAVLQAGARAEALGWLTLCAGEPARFHPLIRVNGNGAGVEPDAKVAAAVAPFLAAARAERERPVGVRLEAPLTRDRRALSPFGAAVAAALHQALGTDFALVNAGALRMDLPAGELRYGQLYEALPFDDDLAVIRLRKAEVEGLLQTLSNGGKGFPQVFGLTWDGAAARTCSGEPLDPGRVYTLGTNEFLAQGGDGVRAVMERVGRRNVALRRGMEMRDAFLALLKRSGNDLPRSSCP
jgi:5'-nucleotidase